MAVNLLSRLFFLEVVALMSLGVGVIVFPFFFFIPCSLLCSVMVVVDGEPLCWRGGGEERVMW